MTKDRLHEMKKLMEEGSKEESGEKAMKEKPTPLITFFEHKIFLLHPDISPTTTAVGIQSRPNSQPTAYQVGEMSAKAIKVEIGELKTRVNDLKALLSDRQQWTNDVIRKELERKIEEEKLIIGTSAKTIRNNLKSINNTPCDGKSSSAVRRIKEVQLNAILSELNDVLRDYLNCLVQHRERSVKILKEMVEVKGDKVTDIESLLEEGKIAIFTNNLLIGDMEEKYKLREAEDRHKGIMKIESSILEIRNLFNELALIVDIQAEKVEGVERIVDENMAKIEKGKKKLESASKKKRKLRHRKVMVALICGGIILVVLVLLTIF